MGPTSNKGGSRGLISLKRNEIFTLLDAFTTHFLIVANDFCKNCRDEEDSDKHFH